MIKIGDKTFYADQVIKIHRSNDVPIQRTESGFDVQDHIRSVPIQLEITVIIFEEESTLHGQWECERVDGRMECTEKTAVPAGTGTYAHLQQLRDDKELVMVDCSKYERAASMIYPDMAITAIEQEPMMGNIFVCRIIFTQITKTLIITEQLYIQETTEDGVETVLWSKEPIEPTNTESATEVAISANPPSCRAISPAGQKVTSKNALEDIWDWAVGKKEGLGGSLLFLVEPGEYTG